MDTQDGRAFIEDLASFIRKHERGLANALISRKSNDNEPWQGLIGTLISPFQRRTADPPKPVVFSITPHHLFYLLSRFEDFGINIGPMNVRLENLHVQSTSTNYVSFLSQHKISQVSRGDAASIESIPRSDNLSGGPFSTFRTSFSRDYYPREQQLQEKSNGQLKYLYSAFTKLPCLKLAPDRRARLIEGYEEFPFDTAVPLYAFKNISTLEIREIDFRQLFGWDRVSEQLRSLIVRNAILEELADLLINIVLDDMDKRRRRSSKASTTLSSAWGSSPSTHLTESSQGGGNSFLVTPRARSQSPLRPSVSSKGASSSVYSHSRSPGPNSSSISEDRSSNTSFSRQSNLLTMGILPTSKWRFLKHLGLPDNGLTSISASSLVPLANTLSSLDLSGNLFAEVPSALASLTSLRALNLSNCIIESLRSLTQNPLPAIKALNLRFNRLSYLAGIERLYPLERVDLRDNLLSNPTEIARLTSLPDIQEIWVLDNPFVKRHSSYRVVIFNLFRTTPGYVEDILIDTYGPSYNERRQLVDRVPEQPIVPVVRHADPTSQDSSFPIRSISNDGPMEIPVPKQGASFKVVQQRKRTPKRRIVDLSLEDSRDTGEAEGTLNSEDYKRKTETLRNEASSRGGWLDILSEEDPKLMGSLQSNMGKDNISLANSTNRNIYPVVESSTLDSRKYQQKDPVRLDAESVSSEETLFSSISVGSSNATSMASAQEDAIEYLSGIFTADVELATLCQEAQGRFSVDKFVRNFMRLLRQYFVDLSSEAENIQQKKAVRFLRGREQRVRLTEKLCGLEASPDQSSRDAMKNLRRQRVDVLHNLNRLLQPITEEVEKRETVVAKSFRVDIGTVSPDNAAGDKKADDRTPEGSIDSHDSIKYGDELPEEFGANTMLELDNLSVPQLASVVEFFNSGSSFKTFKLSLRHFVHPPKMLADAIEDRNLETLQTLLSNKFELVAQDEYAWLHELADLGYTSYEIAELLLEEANDSPWIIFESQNIEGLQMDINYHQTSCVHRGGQNLSSSPKLMSAFPLENAIISDTSSQEQIVHTVQELCGIGGIVPTTSDRSKWNGHIQFDEENLIASVNYAIPVESEFDATKILLRVVKTLRGVCTAISYVQRAGLMCENFTVLCGQSRMQNVELCCINLVYILRFQEDLNVLLKYTDPKRAPHLLENVHRILSPIHFKPMEHKLSLEATTHLCSLVAQFLCLGFLSYSRAHSGAIQPFFLDCPLQNILLLGCSNNPSDLHIDVRLQEFTCMGDMTQEEMLVFHPLENIEELHYKKCDLLASPEDLMDTWGPGQFVTKSSEEGDSRIYAISIGGGTITANPDNADRFHWSSGPGTVGGSFVKSFDQHTKILIGTAVTVNKVCPLDVSQRWMVTSDSLENLGTFQSAWDVAERQAGFQSGQYVNFQFNQTWIKTPGNTLKQIQLDLPDNHLLPFLQSSWGLQVSLCTSVARRVPLRELVADVMPAFVESLFPIPLEWQALKTTHGIFNAFRNSNLQEWLGKLSSELQLLVARIVRYILLTLQYTGIDKKGGHLIIAWIQKNKPFQCFKVPCEKESYWARILADSGDCATFAYITSKCLETEWLKCKGAQSAWQNSSPLLETAVCRHRPADNQAKTPGAVTATPWVLKHADLYSMGKPDSLLWARVERPAGNEQPKLHVEWSMIPRGMRFRLDMRKMPKRLQRLRERQAIDAPAEMDWLLEGVRIVLMLKIVGKEAKLPV